MTTRIVSSSPSREEGWVWGSGLFAISAWWVWRELRRQLRKNHSPFAQLYHRLPRQAGQVAVSGDVTGMVGTRGQAALAPGIPYLKQFLACLENPCDLLRNPQGYVAMCVAENKLVLDLLAERFMQVGTATAAFSDSAVYCYNSFLGMPVAREAAAYFLARRFLFPSEGGEQEAPIETPDTLTPEKALQHIHPSCVALGTGAAPLINHLFYLLGEPGEACLIPAPYYAAFENDMNLIAGIIPVAVHQANPVAGPTDNELDLAFMQARSRGLHPRFLLITNPNNPLGTIYRPEVLLRMVHWARKKSMQTIVDEVYALSTQKKKNHGFHSIIRVLNNDLGSDVHMLWAVSKDFGGSGLRVGVIYSQNRIFLNGLASMSIFTSVSGPIQYLVAELLTDDSYVDAFLDESRNRLQASYQICVQKLDEMVIPYIPAEAGLFVYVDFSSLLPEKTFEYEERLSDLMFEYARVVLTPGESQRDATPGMFRICYAWVTPEVLELAMERLSRLVAKLRRLHWDDLHDKSLGGIL